MSLSNNKYDMNEFKPIKRLSRSNMESEYLIVNETNLRMSPLLTQRYNNLPEVKSTIYKTKQSERFRMDTYYSPVYEAIYLTAEKMEGAGSCFYIKTGSRSGINTMTTTMKKLRPKKGIYLADEDNPDIFIFKNSKERKSHE